MQKLIDYNSKEKDIIIECISNIPLMDTWIATLIENYMYLWCEEIKDDDVKCLYLTRFGEKHGEYKEWFEDGQIKVETTYKDDKMNGEYKQYFENGRVMKEEIYKDGRMIGEYKEYYRNGSLHKQGIADEWFKVYYTRGELLVDAKINGDCIDYWAPHGEQEPLIHALYQRKNGQIDGLYKEYDHNGKLCIEAMHVDGKLYGDYKTYHPNGKLSSEGICVDGYLQTDSFKLVFHGERKEYNQNGQMVHCVKWSNGTLINSERVVQN